MGQELTAKVKEVIRRNYNVKSFRLEPQTARDFKAGQFLMVRLGDGPDLKRYLSISSSPTETCYIEFTKKLTESAFSRKLNDLKAGDQVAIQYPLGKFVLDEACKRIAFLSGGIGITPIRSICKYASDKKLDNDIILLYANRSVRDVVFKDDFDAMMQDNPRLRVTHVLCETEPGFQCTVGMINAGVIRQQIPDYAQRKFYLCGPPQMVEAMADILTQQLEVSPGSIITENFQGY